MSRLNSDVGLCWGSSCLPPLCSPREGGQPGEMAALLEQLLAPGIERCSVRLSLELSVRCMHRIKHGVAPKPVQALTPGWPYPPLLGEAVSFRPLFWPGSHWPEAFVECNPSFSNHPSLDRLNLRDELYKQNLASSFLSLTQYVREQ